MRNQHYNKDLKPYARKLRKENTKAEIRIWCELLRKKQMKEYQFLRQRPIDKYIADFLCKELNLIIEIDGITHTWEDSPAKDNRRTMELNKIGYTVIRFTNNEVFEHLDQIRSTL